jgi:hypothetical protein
MSAAAATGAPALFQRATFRDTAADWLEYDFSKPWRFAALALVYIASRAPFIGLGYGTDPDAWRVALSGYWFWEHHEFYPSRLPGYPLHEYASTLVIKGGSLATNSLTVAISILGLWFFARIADALNLPCRDRVAVDVRAVRGAVRGVPLARRAARGGPHVRGRRGGGGDGSLGADLLGVRAIVLQLL